MSTEDFVENIEWIAEEMGDEIGDENFTIPVDKENAEVLYIPHPLEARDLPGGTSRRRVLAALASARARAEAAARQLETRAGDGDAG